MASLRASLLPQGGAELFGRNAIHCGSGLAREDDSGNTTLSRMETRCYGL